MVSKGDLERLRAVAVGIFGCSLDNVECVPGEGPPVPLEVTADVLEQFLPAAQAGAECQFLKDMEARVHSWLTSEDTVNRFRKRLPPQGAWEKAATPTRRPTARAAQAGCRAR